LTRYLFRSVFATIEECLRNEFFHKLRLKSEKQRERRHNESPVVREKRLEQLRQYPKHNREKNRLNSTEPDGRAGQAVLMTPVQKGEPSDDEADQQQEMDGGTFRGDHGNRLVTKN